MNTDLYNYTLRLADNSLILSHRLAEYISCAPFLEEDLALTNTGLDLIGQAEALLKYAAEQNGTVDEDYLAFGREEYAYMNVHLVEYPNEDYGYVITRQFLMDVYNYFTYTQLKNSKDGTIAAIANKAIKEVTYHLKRSSEWIVRLGDGTEESNERIQACIDHLWMYTDELFDKDDLHIRLFEAGVSTDIDLVKKEWHKMVSDIFEKANLTKPEQPKFSLVYGKNGGHTDYMGYLLAEMQFLKNRFPKEVW